MVTGDTWTCGKGGWGGGPPATRQLAAGFINATSANVSHPFDDIVVTVVQLRFEYLQVAHLEARRREWHLGRGHLQLGTWPSYHISSTLASSMVHPPHLPQGFVNGWGPEVTEECWGGEPTGGYQVELLGIISCLKKAQL